MMRMGWKKGYLFGKVAAELAWVAASWRLQLGKNHWFGLSEAGNPACQGKVQRFPANRLPGLDPDPGVS